MIDEDLTLLITIGDAFKGCIDAIADCLRQRRVPTPKEIEDMVYNATMATTGMGGLPEGKEATARALQDVKAYFNLDN